MCGPCSSWQATPSALLESRHLGRNTEHFELFKHSDKPRRRLVLGIGLVSFAEHGNRLGHQAISSAHQAA